MSKAIEIVEIHFCKNCNKQTEWKGDKSFTNIGGFAFISCEGCGISSVEKEPESFYN